MLPFETAIVHAADFVLSFDPVLKLIRTAITHQWNESCLLFVYVCSTLVRYQWQTTFVLFY